MSRRFIVVVLDGFGIGAMDDVLQVRPEDAGSHTAGHILESTGVRLPVLESMGLCNAMNSYPQRQNPQASFGRSALLHAGADTFLGHQEIMGTLPFPPVKRAFYHSLPAVEAALAAAGHHVTVDRMGTAAILQVDGSVTVGDNIEADFGQAYNVTAALDSIPFEKVLEIGHIVRGCVQVSRVITFGGSGVTFDDLLAAREHKELAGEQYYGVNAPRSGVYNKDYQCIHLGYGVNPAVQLPTLLGQAGVPVTLIGKVADIVANPMGISISSVDTAETMEHTLAAMKQQKSGFLCTNVQETDLCGHRMDAKEYAGRLLMADEYLGKLQKLMTEEDILVVMADHGNDPTIGHSKHTREYVPLLLWGSPLRSAVRLGTRSTLADVGATAGEYLGVTLPQNGSSFLSEILK
ncbi:MAG: phosphopentomutase [Angelakisella sp.]